MNKSKSRSFLITSAAAAIACLLQIYALIRYVNRLPDDWVGILIYAITVVAFALAAVGFYIRWNKEKLKE